MKDYHINGFWSDEALAEVERAKAAWLEAARAKGKPVPPPRYRAAIPLRAS